MHTGEPSEHESNPAAATLPRRRSLPPLILHPFADRNGPGQLMESSRASLMMQGLIPNAEYSMEELERRLLDGRYCEVRMLFYVGRDLTRWIDQCLDFVPTQPDIRNFGYRYQSFAGLLVHQTPPNVVQKLKAWGVADYTAIFARALALNTIFAEVPPREMLADYFVRTYYRFADHIFASRQQVSHPPIPEGLFDFELYASGEYTRMLEEEWSGEESRGR
jgi:hypothetical protein